MENHHPHRIGHRLEFLQLNQPKRSFTTERQFLLSNELSKVTGRTKGSRNDCIRVIWHYILEHNLRISKTKFIADEKLEIIFGNGEIPVFGMARYLERHLKTRHV
ncbi:MAG: hypothetical protein FJ333_10055 [Sphingomonadales bacterium]|nr:hypothetical protein [Sphingomonadales bacterium]